VSTSGLRCDHRPDAATVGANIQHVGCRVPREHVDRHVAKTFIPTLPRRSVVGADEDTENSDLVSSLSTPILLPDSFRKGWVLLIDQNSCLVSNSMESQRFGPYLTDGFSLLPPQDFRNFSHFFLNAGCNVAHVFTIGCGCRVTGSPGI
jgi:hypothetical protein